MKGFLFLLLIVPMISIAEEAPNSELILELCNKMKLCQSLEGIMDIHTEKMKLDYKNIPDNYWNDQKVALTNTKIIQLFQKNFSQKEIELLNKIYDHSVMEDLEFKRANILTEAMDAMTDWRLNFEPDSVMNGQAYDQTD
jgi:hypothetical protein